MGGRGQGPALQQEELPHDQYCLPGAMSGHMDRESPSTELGQADSA